MRGVAPKSICARRRAAFMPLRRSTKEALGFSSASPIVPSKRPKGRAPFDLSNAKNLSLAIFPGFSGYSCFARKNRVEGFVEHGKLTS
jgi:hypothetical protein